LRSQLPIDIKLSDFSSKLPPTPEHIIMATFTGTNGDDTIFGNALYNTINAGAGNDDIYINIPRVAYTIDGGVGNDRLNISSSADTANTSINYTNLSTVKRHLTWNLKSHDMILS
jgi:hypothetical protein